MVSHPGCVLYQVLALHYVQHSDGCSASQVVSAECGTQLAVYRLELRADEYTAHRIAVGNTLCHSDDVRFDTIILMREELSAASVTRLNFVEDEYGTGLVAFLSQSIGKLLCESLDSANALDALHYHGADVTLGQFRLQSFAVVQRKESHMTVIVYRSHNLRIVCHLHGQRCTSVERFRKRNHAGATVVERSQLQSVLVRLGTGVYEEELIIVVSAHRAQASGQFLLQSVDDRV